jgi:hypothetical protein
MPNTLVITKVGPDADRILDAFEQRTKLAARDGDTARIFTLEGAGHGIDVSAELGAIDPDWSQHVEVATQVSP